MNAKERIEEATVWAIVVGAFALVYAVGRMLE